MMELLDTGNNMNPYHLKKAMNFDTKELYWVFLNKTCWKLILFIYVLKMTGQEKYARITKV